MFICVLEGGNFQISFNLKLNLQSNEHYVMADIIVGSSTASGLSIHLSPGVSFGLGVAWFWEGRWVAQYVQPVEHISTIKLNYVECVMCLTIMLCSC